MVNDNHKYRNNEFIGGLKWNINHNIISNPPVQKNIK